MNLPIMIEIEAAIVNGLHPDFLAISPVEGTIHVIVSHPSFEHKSIPVRIKIIYDLINRYNIDILKNNVVIVETFDHEQMTDLLEDALNEV